MAYITERKAGVENKILIQAQVTVPGKPHAYRPYCAWIRHTAVLGVRSASAAQYPQTCFSHAAVHCSFSSLAMLGSASPYCGSLVRLPTAVGPPNVHARCTHEMSKTLGIYACMDDVPARVPRTRDPAIQGPRSHLHRMDQPPCPFVATRQCTHRHSRCTYVRVGLVILASIRWIDWSLTLEPAAV